MERGPFEVVTGLGFEMCDFHFVSFVSVYRDNNTLFKACQGVSSLSGIMTAL